jgi:hypothetical protein
VHDRTDLARAVLSNAPQILRQSWLLSDIHQDLTAGADARALLEIVRRCAEGDNAAVQAGRRLLAAEPLAPNLAQDAAAWNALFTEELTRSAPLGRLIADVVGPCAAPHPLLTDLLQHYPPRASCGFEQVDVLSCQHILGSVLPQYVAIRELLPGAQFWQILGKPYSANPWAIRLLEDAGFTFNHDSATLPERESYALGSFAQRQRQLTRASVSRFFSLMPESVKLSRAPIIVIDDGGALISAVASAAKACGTTRPIACVEQTQRGLHAAHPATGTRTAPPGGIAIVNVAQSLSKLVLESRLIGTSVVENIQAWLSLLGVSATDDLRASSLTIGVIGFGSVGGAVAAELQAHDVVPHIYDSNRNRLAEAKRRRYNVALTLEDFLAGCSVIVGATNGSWLDRRTAAYLRDEVILASASSGDIEFHGLPAEWKADQLTVLDPALPSSAFDTIHGEIRMYRPDQATMHILNGGFPVNFNGALDPIDPGQIQLTRALMLAGILQIIGCDGVDAPSLAGQTGVFALHTAFDEFLFESYEHGTQIDS